MFVSVCVRGGWSSPDFRDIIPERSTPGCAGMGQSVLLLWPRVSQVWDGEPERAWNGEVFPAGLSQEASKLIPVLQTGLNLQKIPTGPSWLHPVEPDPKIQAGILLLGHYQG